MRKLIKKLCLFGLLACFGVLCGQARLDAAPAPDPDLNNDGIVNSLDVSLVSSCVGKNPRTPPAVITPLSPGNGAFVTASPISVTGKVDNGTATVTVNGKPATVQAGGSFAADGISLQPGSNTIIITATLPANRCQTADTDDDGDVDLVDLRYVSSSLGKRGFPLTGPTPTPTVSTLNFVVFLGPGELTISIKNPSEGALLNSNRVNVLGSVNDPASAVEVNGVNASVGPDGSFTASGVSLQEGENTLTARATRSFGNQASTSIKVTLDTTPPVIAITTPPDNATVFTPQVRLAGTIDDKQAQLTINGQTVPVANGVWETEIPVALGLNTIVARATDLAGNAAERIINITREEPRLVSISISPAGLWFSSAGLQRALVVEGRYSDGKAQVLTGASTGTVYQSSNSYVAKVSPEGIVNSIENGSSTITARNGDYSATSKVTVEIGVNLEQINLSPKEITLRDSGATQQLSLTGTFSDGSTRDITSGVSGTVYSSSDTSAAQVSSNGLVTAVAPGTATITATNGNLSGTARVSVVFATSKGFLRGRVYDDSKGLPLEGATVTLIADGSGLLDPQITTTTDKQGRYVLHGLEGDALVEVHKSGFSSIEKHGRFPSRTATRLLDARLTPLDSKSTTVVAVAGGQALDSTGKLKLSIAPGAIEADTQVQVTAISNQGLQERLPMGWSPIAAADVRPLGMDFSQPALLLLPNSLDLPTGTEITAAYYDRLEHRWIGMGSAHVIEDKNYIECLLTRSGQVAILLPDNLPFTPPIPEGGQTLQGVDPVALPQGLVSTGQVLPPSAPPGEKARAVGIVNLGTAALVPSGTAVEAHVSERFKLLDSTVVVPSPYTQDLLLFSRHSLEATSGIGAQFPITPSRDFTIQELELGTILLDITPSEQASGGSAIGSPGGTVSEPGGAAVEIPSGATGQEIFVQLLTFEPDFLSLTLPDGAGILAALELDLAGALLAQSAQLSIQRPASMPAEVQVFLAKVLTDHSGVPLLKVVALGQVGPTRITTLPSIPGLTFPGVTEGGHYLFIVSPVPLGFISGKVSTSGGTVGRADVLVTSSTAPFADLTDTAGNYLIAGEISQETNVTALDQFNGNLAAAKITLQTINEAANLDLALQAVGPRVLSLSPAAGATDVPLSTSILVQFSEAISPSTVTSATVTLQANGSPVEIRRSLSPDGCTMTIVPVAALQSKTVYTLLLTQGLTDLAGNALSAPAGISFTTVDTSKPLPPPAGLITARLPDDDGLVLTFGTQGTAEPGTAVTAANLRTLETFTIMSATDGSFRIRLAAVIGDQVSLIFRNSSGQNVTHVIKQFEDPDGSTALGVQGGTITGPAGEIGTVLERALKKAGIFKLKALTDPAVIPALPTGFNLVDGFELTIQRAEFNLLRSLTLKESQNRFEPQIQSIAPFSASGSLTVPSDFIVNGDINYSASAEDSDGNRNTATQSSLVVSSTPDTTLALASKTDRFPTVYLWAPSQAVPNQQTGATAVAPTARVDFKLPVPPGTPPGAAFLLCRLTTLNGTPRLSLVDRLEITSENLMTTCGLEMHGATLSGSYAVISLPGPVATVYGRVRGPSRTVALAGTPFVFETNGPSEGFSLPVLAGQYFTLEFLDPQTGLVIGSASDTAPLSGSLNLGDPIGQSVPELRVSAQPDARSIVDIKEAIVFRFSEPIDTRTFNAGTVVVTDAAGNRVYGKFSFSDDATRATFTPLRRWKYASTYRYGITTGVVGLSGAMLSRQFTGTFTTFAPKLLGSNPADKVRDVAVYGNLALLAGDKGINVLDVAEADNVALLSQTAVAGGASGVCILDDPGLGGVVGLAATGSEATKGFLRIFDLNFPQTPQVIGSAQLTTPAGQSAWPNVPDAPGVPNAVAAGQDQKAYLAVQGIGVETVDLSLAIPESPSDPGKALSGRYPADTLESYNHVAALDTVLLAAGAKGLTILDAQSTQKLGSASTSGNAQGVAGLSAFGMDLNGDGVIDKKSEVFDLAVVANGADGAILLYNINDPGAPVLVSVVRLGLEANAVALDRGENLAYVACGNKGLRIVDLAGPASVQPIDLDFNGIDDRILGQVSTAGTAKRLALDLGRGAGFVADGTAGISAVQLIPPRGRFVDVLRDPVAAATGDENSILETREAYLTDDALKVSLSAVVPQSSLFLTIEEIPESGGFPVLSLSGGGSSIPLSGGLNNLTISINKSVTSNGSRAVLRIQDRSGWILDTLELRLARPDLTNAELRSIFIAPREITIPVDRQTAQVSVAGVFTDSRIYNLTSSSRGTSYEIMNSFVATIGTEGLISGIAGGATSVTARNGEKTATATLNVEYPPVIRSIGIETPYVTLTDPGAMQQLSVLGLLSNDGTLDVTLGAGTLFSSSDPGVVIVDSKGNLTAVGEGTATITITNGDYTIQVQVAVEFRDPPTVTGIDLAPFTELVTTDTGEVLAKATIHGTGSLEGISVVFSTSGGVPDVTGTTDYSGIAMARIKGLTVAGERTVTASVLDPAEGTRFSNSKVLFVEAGSGDIEPNNDLAGASRLGAKKPVQGSVGGPSDLRDTYFMDFTTDGTLTVNFASVSAFAPGEVNLIIYNSPGVELARSSPSGLTSELRGDVPAGRNYIMIEAITSISYQVSCDFKQAPVTTVSVSPSAGGAGTPVTISGSGFSTNANENSISFGVVPCKVISSSATEINVIVPAQAVDANIRVKVMSQSAQGPFFSVANPGSPPPISIVAPDPLKVRIDPNDDTLVNVSRIHVRYDPQATRSEIEVLADSLGGSIVGHFPDISIFILDFPNVSTLHGIESIRKTLRTNPIVTSTFRSTYLHPDSVPFTLDSYAGDAFQRRAYEKIQLAEAVQAIRSHPNFLSSSDFEEVEIAVIDSGFDPLPDWEFKFGDNCIVELMEHRSPAGSFLASKRYEDLQGHGTSVTGLIAALNNGVFPIMNGVSSSIYMPQERPKLKVSVFRVEQEVPNFGYCLGKVVLGFSNDLIFAAINQINRNLSKAIVNMSLEQRHENQTEVDNDKRYYESLFNSDNLFVIAAGNEGRDANLTTPAAMSYLSNVISVGSTEYSDRRANHSNYGDQIEIAAPGVNAYVPMSKTTATNSQIPNCSIENRNSYKNQSGTSFACPMVAGAAAILKSIWPRQESFTPELAKKLLIDSADNISATWSMGSMRRLNVHRAVLQVLPPFSDQYIYIANKSSPTSSDLRQILAIPIDPLSLEVENDASRAIPLSICPPGGDCSLLAVNPMALAVSPPGNELYALVDSMLPDLGSGLLVINTQTKKAHRFIPLSGASFPPDGTTQQPDPVVVSISRPDMVFSKDGRLLYVSAGERIIIINVDKGKVVERSDDLPYTCNMSIPLIYPFINLKNELTALGPSYYWSSLEMSNDGRTLYALAAAGVGQGAEYPGRIFAIDVDLYGSRPGEAVDIARYFTIKELGFGIQPTYIIKDDPIGLALSSPDLPTQKEYLYMLHGGAKFGSDGITAPGVTVVFENSGSFPIGNFRSFSVIGNDLPPANVLPDAINSIRPSSISVRPDGRRALVSFFQTGNFGVLDLDAQAAFELGDSYFKKYAAFTPCIPLDDYLWPKSPNDVALLYPWKVEYAQNGKFAVAIHGGSSGHSECWDAETQQTNPDCPAAEDKGAVSIINDRVISSEFQEYLLDKVLGGITSYYSCFPIEGAVTTLRTYNGIPFKNPRAVAIQPFVYFLEPRFGDYVNMQATIAVEWRDPRVKRISFTLSDADQLTSIGLPKTVGFPVSESQRSFTCQLFELMDGVSLENGRRYKIELQAITDSGVLSSTNIIISYVALQ